MYVLDVGVVRRHQRALLVQPFVLCTVTVQLACRDLGDVDADLTPDLGPMDDDVVRHSVDVGKNDADTGPDSMPEAYLVQGYPSETRRLVRLGTVGIVVNCGNRWNLRLG